jgi:hypothetical protein
MTDSKSVRLTPRPWTAGRGRSPAPPAGGQPRAAETGRSGPTLLVGSIAVAGIGGALVIMIAATVFRQDWMYPTLRLPAVGFPFAAVGVPVPKLAVVAALWLSALLAAAGIAAGLVAARRGARPPIRLILIGAAIVIAVLAILPPAGSTDVLDYASYGRLLVLGHNPYVVPPDLLRVSDSGFGLQVPVRWQHQVSLYGPLATFEQYAAAKLGGDTPARIVFWLKLWNAIAFGAVALIADRLLASDPARRLRAHLLWTLNPLLLWGLIAAGHLDALAAAAGLLSLLVLGAPSAAGRPTLLRAAAAGALLGAAGDIKINYLAFGLGLAWALRRRPAGMLAAAAGALVVLVPTYAAFGMVALTDLVARRDTSAVDSFYRLGGLNTVHGLGLAAAVLVVGVALLLLWRLPPDDILRPALRPALAVSLAWLVMWPYQLPWYDAMAICLLLLYPASWLDFLVVARLAIATMANLPGNGAAPTGHGLAVVDNVIVHVAAPLTLLACAIWLVAMAVTGRWGNVGAVGDPQAYD